MGGKASQKDVQRVLGMRYEGSWEAKGRRSHAMKGYEVAALGEEVSRLSRVVSRAEQAAQNYGLQLIGPSA